VLTEKQLVSINSYKAYSCMWIREDILRFFVDRNLKNILRCSLIIMSDGELLLELGSSHCRRQGELVINAFSGHTCLWKTL